MTCVNGIAIRDFPKKLKPAVVPGRYVIPGYQATDRIAALVTAGRIYYIPIFVTETTTYIRIGVYVETALAGTADLRIFAWDNGVPGKLILSAGTVDTSTTGGKEITISQTLSRGYYFLAFRCTSACQLYGLKGESSVVVPAAGLRTTTYPNPRYCVPFVTAAYADPAPAPDAASIIEAGCVFLRES